MTNIFVLFLSYFAFSSSSFGLCLLRTLCARRRRSSTSTRPKLYTVAAVFYTFLPSASTHKATQNTTPTKKLVTRPTFQLKIKRTSVHTPVFTQTQQFATHFTNHWFLNDVNQNRIGLNHIIVLEHLETIK